MVREYSASGQPQPADGGAAVQPLDLRSSTASLTQELSQLLAQTIAQGQATKLAPNPAAAGAQFSNLVALVSTATQTQRGHQPTYRDGLSSLSYARPAQPPAPPPPPAPVMAPPPPTLAPASSIMAPASSHMAPASSLMAPQSSGLLVSEPHDEEPMPIPSTWRQPTLGDDDRWYRQQLGAAGMGLLAGLVVVVPAVLWLSGIFGGSQTKAVARQHVAEVAPPPVKVAEVKPVKVASEPRVAALPPVEPVERALPPPQARAVIMEPPPAVVAAIPPPPRQVEPVRSRADDLLAMAKRRIEGGDVAGAREIMLQAPETGSSAPMVFLLAETYDPNMLASWQTRGVTANPERARALYLKARDLGDSRAQQRLDWLTAN
jgi:hypothetical protein